MAENEDQERNEASPKRKEEARKKGQVAKSREVTSVAVLMGCLLYLYFGSSAMVTADGHHVQTLAGEPDHVVISTRSGA